MLAVTVIVLYIYLFAHMLTQIACMQCTKMHKLLVGDKAMCKHDFANGKSIWKCWAERESNNSILMTLLGKLEHYRFCIKVMVEKGNIFKIN